MSESSLIPERIESRDAIEGQIVMPFYIVCDVSLSMESDIGALVEALNEMVGQITSSPVANDLTMIGVITFHSDGWVHIPLNRASRIARPMSLPKVGGAGTSYDAALHALHDAMKADRKRLFDEGRRVYRSCVFFLTDGEPNTPDDSSYRQTMRSLFGYDAETGKGNKAFPYIVAYGFRDATATHLASLAFPDFGPKRGEWYLVKSTSVRDVLMAILPVLGQTIVNSGLTAGYGQPQLAVQRPPDGVIAQFGEAGDFPGE